MLPRSLLAVAGLVPLLTACYTQRPLSTSVPPATTRIVAQVTDAGVVELAPTIGAHAVEVEGVVTAADASSWDLQLLRVNYRGGTSTLWNRERVTFPRYALTNVSERSLNKRKSWLVAGLIAGSAILAARVFGAFGFGGSSGGEPPPPN